MSRKFEVEVEANIQKKYVLNAETVEAAINLAKQTFYIEFGDLTKGNSFEVNVNLLENW